MRRLQLLESGSATAWPCDPPVSLLDLVESLLPRLKDEGTSDTSFNCKTPQEARVTCVCPQQVLTLCLRTSTVNSQVCMIWTLNLRNFTDLQWLSRVTFLREKQSYPYFQKVKAEGDGKIMYRLDELNIHFGNPGTRDPCIDGKKSKFRTQKRNYYFTQWEGNERNVFPRGDSG